MTKTKTTKGTKRPKKETPERNALDVDALYEAATNRAAANPSKAMQTAADLLDLFERLIMQAENAAGANVETPLDARAAFLALLLRTKAAARPVCNIAAKFDKIRPTLEGNKYALDVALKWRDKWAVQYPKTVFISIRATV